MPIEVKSICDFINPQGIGKYKVCTECNEEKLLEEFYKELRNKKDGKVSKCKSCLSKMTKEWKKNNEIQYKENIKYQRYGITLKEFNSQLEKQNNTCCICKKEFNKKLYPCIDHIEGTLNIRGILCHKCNSFIGYANHDINILLESIKYLEKAPVIIGNKSRRLSFTEKLKNISNRYKGVSKTKNGRYSVQIRKNKIKLNFGVFDFPEEAARVYDTKILELYPDIDHKYLNNIPKDWTPILNLEF